MRRDLIIGVIVSVVLHGGAAMIGEWMNDSGPTKAKIEEEPLEVFIAPPLPPEEPEVIESLEAESKPIEFQPPRQQDVPQVVTPEMFVQPIQPVPLDSLKGNAGAITIPLGDINSAVGKVFDPSMLDQQAQPTLQSNPVYPVAMRKQGVKGEVTVRFVVDSTGKVLTPTVVRSSQREFEQAALEAVSKWKFRAGRKGGKPVASWLEVPIIFKIN